MDYGKDKFPDDLPVYHEALTQTEDQAKAHLEAAASKNKVMARAQGMKTLGRPSLTVRHDAENHARCESIARRNDCRRGSDDEAAAAAVTS